MNSIWSVVATVASFPLVKVIKLVIAILAAVLEFLGQKSGNSK